jgi:hypothetical protein
VKVSRVPDIDEFLDPDSLTPQELYKLQSETWVQGAEYERERIIRLLLNGWVDESSPIIKEIRGE